MSIKISRNDPCPCGSGKKYKKCHLWTGVSSLVNPIFTKTEPTSETKHKKRKKGLKKQKNEPQPWIPVKMKMFRMPSPFPENLTKAQRLEIIKSVGAKAKKDFDEKYPSIEKWFSEYDALYVLSFCAMYFTSSPEGIDPEATGHLDFPMHFLEVMQAFALYQDRQMTAKPLLQNAENLQKEMREIGELMMLRLVNIPEGLPTDEEMRAHHLRSEMIANTTAVRNWAYYHQIKQVVLDLAAKVDIDFKKIYGVGSLKFFQIIFQLTEERNNLLNDHLDKVRGFFKKTNYKEVVEAYNNAFPENTPVTDEDLEKIWGSAGKKLKNLKSMLVYHSDLKLEQLFSFDIGHALSLAGEDISKKSLKSLFDRLSYNFGDLKEFNKEHIILNNPVQHKPFIKVQDDKYYTSIWGVMSHILLDILEELISVDSELRKKYFDEIKSTYLEDRVEEIFRKGFPNAQILRGSLWGDYENDLIVIIDTFAIVVEEKARLISPTARRGASLDLPETLKRLIEEPSEQSLKFIDYLKSKNEEIALQTKNGGTNKIDPRKIKYYIPLGVTFHHLGMISSNLKKLIDAKVVDKKLEQLAPSMSFTDLETVFQLLPLESEKVHYLARRREFEAHMEYEGDELDLFGFYLDNGFNIGDAEYARDVMMNIGLKSKELDPYIIGTAEGKTLKKPELAMTQWWKDLLNVIAAKRMHGWMETSFALLNSTKEDQEDFEKKFGVLVTGVLKGTLEKPHNWVMFLSGPERRRYAIAGYPYTTTDKELRNNIMSQILDSDDAKKARGGVVIGVNVNRPSYPYTVLAGRMATDLFDTLTLK